jgi:2-oxoglutarate ferredoxin oxidoreductase subunit beta
MTVICMNNWIYGMTGGQGSPTTPRGAQTTTTPYGSGEGVFDLAALAMAAGANHVARWTSYHVKELTRAIQTGLETPGFSLVEVLTQCPTAYGRRNKLREVSDMIEYLKTHAVLLQKYNRLIAEGKPVPEDMFTVGEFVRRNRPAMGVPP